MIDLKVRRESAGLTQAALATAAGVKRSTIAMIETGVNRPSVPLAQTLGEILGLDWADFYTEGEDAFATNSEGSRSEVASQ